MRLISPLVILALIAWALLTLAPDIRHAVGSDTDCDVEGEPCGEPPDRPTASTARSVALDSLSVCAESGYLCAGFAERDQWRVLRWNDDTQEITIRVPKPLHMSGARAWELQRAVARGVRAWQGHPFPLRVSLSEAPGRYDIVVTWAETLGAVELGEARTEWQTVDGRAVFRVVSFSLATSNPYAPRQPLSARQVEIIAAHEMGHALGLPHSDAERDVMFPSNTATRLTARDYQAMQALYELPNGAEVRTTR